MSMEERYREALRILNRAEVARATGRGRSTLDAYAFGTRRVTAEAAQELVEYLRARSSTLSIAADAIEAALQEEDDGEEV